MKLQMSLQNGHLTPWDNCQQCVCDHKFRLGLLWDSQIIDEATMISMILVSIPMANTFEIIVN